MIFGQVLSLGTLKKTVIFYCFQNFMPEYYTPLAFLLLVSSLIVIIGMLGMIVFLWKLIYRFAEDFLEDRLYLKILVFVLLVSLIVVLVLRDALSLEGYVVMSALFIFGIGFISYLVNLATVYE